MKFARYLQDTQTPEWKKAYIDYRGLKVQLGVIRAQVPQQLDASSSFEAADPHDSAANEEQYDNSKDAHRSQGNTTSTTIPCAKSSSTDSNAPESPLPIRGRTSNQERPPLILTLASVPPRVTNTRSNAPSQQTPLPPRTPRSPPIFPFLRDSGSPTPLPLRTILINLPVSHAKFFDMLDAELDKVETFYAEREKEMYDRAQRLREQLNELVIHRRMCHHSTTHSVTQKWAKRAVPPVLSSLVQWHPEPDIKSEPHGFGASGILASESGRGGHHGNGAVETSNLNVQLEHRRRSGDYYHSRSKRETVNGEGEKQCGRSSKDNTSPSPDAQDEPVRSPPKRSSSLPRLSFGGTRNPLDNEYQHAKRRLRKAAIEHYRGLEVLNNFRILNLVGFRKALKKYEKITNNSVLDAYIKEKVEPSAFASGAMVSTMLKEMEDLFTTRFERGDRKKALDRLRAGPFLNTHHFSTFRSGVWLGLAFNAVAEGIHLSFQESTRRSLLSWNILLYIYSILVVPVLLALLIGINIAVWSRERINYVFIFELNPKSRLDHHEYFELPSFLLCTLCCAFWLSMAQAGPPMLWPLIWFALTILVMFNPICSFMWGPARWWIIKNIAKLMASGIWKVEFTDFWLGDQFCSLAYSISNLYFVGCFYARFFDTSAISTGHALLSSDSMQHATLNPNVSSTYQVESSTAKSAFQSLVLSAYDPQAQDAWSTCGEARNWGWYYILAALPFAIRFVQSLRRYRDSKLPTHLINAGKYGMGMIYYFFYHYWKHRGNPHNGPSYILLFFTGITYSIYACAWDFLMDWSMCKPHARYPLLRPELVYKSQIPSYYFALVSNLCIRFVWLTYPPVMRLDPTLRSFIASMLEMLRRVQWNFYRVENEHLGNVDQYRVTREVPLPYNFDVQSNEDEEEREEDVHQSPSWLKKHLPRLRRNGGHG